MNDDYMRCTGCAKLQLVEHLGQLVCTACGVVNPHVVRDLDTPSSQTERAGKRARVTDESTCKWTLDHGADEDDEEAERIASNAAASMPNDTMVGIQLLLSQFPRLPKIEVAPLLIKTQLYSIVTDCTEVDRALDQMRRDGVLRMFKLPTAADDYACMFTADYRAQVRGGKQRALSQGQTDEAVTVFDWFERKLLQAWKEVSISQEELMDQLAKSCSCGKSPRPAHITAEQRSFLDRQVSLLINAGLLSRQLTSGTTNRGGESYWFAIPNVGHVAKFLVKGRAEILGIMARRKYNEIMQKELEKRKLQTSGLGMLFHLRDLFGSRKLMRVETTCGTMLRLRKE